MKYLLILTILLSACTSTKRTAKTAIERDTLSRIEYRDRIIPIESTQVDTVIQFASLPVDRVVYVSDPTDQARLKLMRDKYNRLSAECESSPSPIVCTDTIVKERIVYREQQTETNQTTRNRWGVAEWLVVLAVLLGAWWVWNRFRR